MKPKSTKTTSHKTARAIALVLSFVAAAWFGFAPASAQSNKARRVVSMKANDSREGAKVTVVADVALNDYEAFRRGDRFSVKLPASEFASAQPNFRGNGFEDVQVQRSGANVLISFKLQPGATARVDQRGNRLDVVFTSSAKQTENQSNGAGSSQNVGSANTQNRDRRTGDNAGPLPPNSPGTVRNSSDQNTADHARGQSTAQSSESDPRKKPESSSTSVPSQADTSQPGSPIAVVDSSGTPYPFATPAPSIDTAPEAQFQNQNSAGSSPAVPSATPSSTTNSERWRWAQQWWRLNWQLGAAIIALLLGGLFFLLFLLLKRFRAQRTANKWQPVKRWQGEKVGPSSKPVVTQPIAGSAAPIIDELVKTNRAATPRVEVKETVKAATLEPEVIETVKPPVQQARVVETASTAIEKEEDLKLSLDEPIISQLPDVKESPVEPPFSNPPAHFERADFEVKKLLSGKEFDVNLIDAADLPTRQIVGASLVAALASRNFEQHHHARKAFVDYGYFDETTRELRTADSPAERSAAARKLGVVGDSRGAAHLIAALFDSAPEVRRASVESLGQIGDPSALQPLNDLLQRETSRQLPEAVVRHAINSITVTEVKRTSPVEKSSLRVVDAYRQEANEEFSKLIDELQREDSEPQGFSFTSSHVTPPPVTPPAPQSVMSTEEVKLQLEEDSLRKAAADLDRRRMEAETTRQRAEEEARLKAEREAQARAEIEARMRAEEEARRLAEQEALRRQIEEEARAQAEQESKLKAEHEARLRAEAEAQFRQEADTLRRAAEELARKRVEADAARRLAEEHTRKQLEAEARQRAEEEAKRQAEDQMRREVELEMQRRVEEQARQLAAAEVRKRLEDEARQQIESEARKRAEEDARRRAEEETAQRAGRQTHRLFEGEVRIVEQDPLRLPPTDAFLLEAEERRRVEEERLQEEHQALLRAADDVARRRREVEQSRIKAEEEARLLVEAQERIRIEEENRRKVTEERQHLEIEARRRAEEERQRFEEARQRTIEDQKRREDEARRKAEDESKLLAEAQERIRAEEEVRHLAELQRQRLEQEARIRAEQERRRLEEAQQRAMIEQQQLVETARLRAEEEARLLVAAQQRIQAEEEARIQAVTQRERLEQEALALEEGRKRSEETLRRTAEEQRRVEEEARRLAEEEGQRLTELEAVRKRAEDQARQRAEVEQRIRAEIEALHKAEEEQRIRIESETRRRSEAEVKLREEKARRQTEENARIQAEREAFLAEEARLKSEEEARRRTEDEARFNAERDARQRAEEEARRREEDAERQRIELEQRLRLEAEAQRQADEEYRLRAEAEAQRQADEEYRLRAEEEARIREEDERFRKIQEEAQRQAEEIDRHQSERAQLLADERAFGLESQESVVDNSADSAPEEVWGEVALTKSTSEVAEPVVQKRVEAPASVQSADKGIDVVRAEKGIAPIGEDSDIPAELLHRLNSTSTVERSGALTDISRLGGEDSFRLISKAFDDPSPDVRNAAARALYSLQADRAASFTRALREGTPERRRNIGSSLASSGLASDAIANLTGESREKTYDAFSLLFLMAKAGEVQPLMKAIEDYPNIEVRLAVVKLLALSGQPEIVPAFRRLAVRGSLPSEVRSAVMEAIYQISSQNRETAPSAA